MRLLPLFLAACGTGDVAITCDASHYDGLDPADPTPVDGRTWDDLASAYDGLHASDDVAALGPLGLEPGSISLAIEADPSTLRAVTDPASTCVPLRVEAEMTLTLDEEVFPCASGKLGVHADGTWELAASCGRGLPATHPYREAFAAWLASRGATAAFEDLVVDAEGGSVDVGMDARDANGRTFGLIATFTLP